MWADFELRLWELVGLVRYFNYRNECTKTASQVVDFAVKLATSKSPSLIKRSFARLIDTFRTDFARGDGIRGLLFDIVRVITLVSMASSERRKRLEALLPLFYEALNNSENFMPILEAFQPYSDQGDMRMRYYGMYLLYLFNAEGIFDAATRILWGMGLIGRDQEVPQNLSDIGWRDVKEGLHQIDLPGELLFAGWADGRLRNAIAHSRMTYDKLRGTMRFQDRQTSTNPSFDRTLSIYAFSDYCTNLDNPFHMIVNYQLIIRIWQLGFDPKPPGLGTRSAFDRWKDSPLMEGV